MFFKKFLISLFFLSIITLPILAENESAIIPAEFKLKNSRLYTSFLEQNFVYSPIEDTITANCWAEGAYVVIFSSGAVHTYYKKGDKWQLKQANSYGDTLIHNLTCISKSGIEDLRFQLPFAKTEIYFSKDSTISSERRDSSIIYDCGKMTVWDSLKIKDDDCFMKNGWKFVIFQRRLVIMQKEDQFFILSAHFREKRGELYWSCTHLQYTFEFNRFNEFFIKAREAEKIVGRGLIATRPLLEK